jgi:hypothetical protein
MKLWIVSLVVGKTVKCINSFDIVLNYERFARKPRRINCVIIQDKRNAGYIQYQLPWMLVPRAGVQPWYL